MDVRGIKDLFEQSPIIAAVKSEELLQKALESECMMVFILYGSICTIDAIVDQVKARGRSPSSTQIWWRGWPARIRSGRNSSAATPRRMESSAPSSKWSGGQRNWA